MTETRDMPVADVSNFNASAAPLTRPMLLPTTDGLNLFVRRWFPEGEAKAIVQIAHGVAEHSGRYARLAEALNLAGYAVYANDHRGHGHTARTPNELGYFADRGGWRKCVDDLWRVNRYIAAEHPGVPIVLLGHSMGSFMTQQFIAEYGEALHAAVLAGTSGKPTPTYGVVRFLARLERLRVGRRGTSSLLNALTFEAFNDQFQPAMTPFDWISRDATEVAKYAADPLCGGFRASVQLCIDVLVGMCEMSDKKRVSGIPKCLPIYVIAGTADSVGANGEGVNRLLGAYFDAGLKHVAHCFYEGARHELFNEINRDQVTDDLVRWLNEVVH
jgi:alpha-beta hydrolase superfamily lysophospholipase